MSGSTTERPESDTPIDTTRTENVMTTTQTHPRGAVRRIWALGLMELRLMLRNKTAVVNVLLMAPFMVLLMSSFLEPPQDGRGLFAGTLMTGLLSFALLFIAYYTLVTSAVARREELMLKRLTTGEVTKSEILVAMCVPVLVFVLLQLVLGWVAVSFLLDPPPTPNVVLVMIGTLLGFVVFALLAFVSSAFTKTVEAAQITTVPVLIVALLPSGLAFPLTGLPETAQTVAAMTPLAPVVTLLNLGLSGITPDGDLVSAGETWGHAWLPIAVLIGWIVVSGYLVRRFMRWEPRR